MEEVLCGLTPGGPYAEPTAGRSATIDLWCNDDSDILIVHRDTDGRVLSDIETTVDVREHVVDGEHAVVVTESCLQDRSITVEPILIDHDCLLIPPLRYVEGRKFCRVWALDTDDLTRLYHDLQANWSVSIEAKRTVTHFRGDFPGFSIETGRPDLSNRQTEAVRTAVERGYYEIPRQTTTADIAEKMGVTRRTAENHLRIAEQKLIESMVRGR